MDWDKLTYKNPKIAEQLQIEIDVMEKNSHLNLVKLYKHVVCEHVERGVTVRSCLCAS